MKQTYNPKQYDRRLSGLLFEEGFQAKPPNRISDKILEGVEKS